MERSSGGRGHGKFGERVQKSAGFQLEVASTEVRDQLIAHGTIRRNLYWFVNVKQK